MNHQFSSTEWVEKDLTTMLSHRKQDKRPNRTGKTSIRAMFKFLREQPKYTLLGDYPLIASATSFYHQFIGSLRRSFLLSTLNASEEFRGRVVGKKDLVNNLLAL